MLLPPSKISTVLENIPSFPTRRMISDFVQGLFKDLNVMIDGILPEDLDVKDIKEEAKEIKDS